MPLEPEERWQLAQEYGIKRKFKQDWPECYKNLFRNVQRLGDKRFEEWEEEFKSLDPCSSGTKKWHNRTKHQAIRLMRKARKLGEDWRNLTEADWRSLEEIIFLHLNEDVHCHRCSRRWWRSHDGVDTECVSVTRQKQRKLCNCSQPICHDSSIFEPRREAAITYDTPLKTAMQKAYERADLFYGLSQKGRLQEYLRRLTEKSAVRTTPFARKFTGCVFPFIVSEAKAANAVVNESQIELQIGFTVRETLLAQRSLASAVNSGQLAFKPLVWCVTLQGETISITAACLAPKDGNSHKGDYSTYLMRIWSGSLCSEDDALRCLLIIDYVADWARNLYRENVIKQLKSIVGATLKPTVPVFPTRTSVSHDGHSESDDNDLESDANKVGYNALHARGSRTSVKRHRFATSERQSSTEPDSDSHSDDSSSEPMMLESPPHKKSVGLVHALVPHNTAADPVDKMRRFDSAMYAYRDARYIRCRVVGLCITSDNVQDLFNSRAKGDAESLFSRIAVQLEKHQLAQMKGSTLAAMEEAWSGIKNSKSHIPYGAETFYISFTFSAYCSPDWEQTRKLCYIAVSKNALDTIKRCRRAETKLAVYKVSHERALGIIGVFQNASVSSNLSACLQCCSVRPIYAETYETRDLQDIFPKHRNLESTWMKDDTHRKTRDVVWTLYKGIVGEGENSSRSYLRLRSTLYEQTQPKRSTRQQNSSPWISCILKPKEHFILSYDANPDGLKQEQRPEWCMFWANPDEFKLSLWTSKFKETRLELIYRTSRLGMGKRWQRITWNETDLLVTGFNGKVVSEKCLDALFSALTKDDQQSASDGQETDIDYALSQLRIHSNGSDPRQLRDKRVNEDHLGELSDENSDTRRKYPGNFAASLQASGPSDSDVSFDESGDEAIANIDPSACGEKERRSISSFGRRYRPRGLLSMDYYRRKKHNAA